MLEEIRRAELKGFSAYIECAEQAEAFGDTALAIQPEDVIQDESGHAEETERMLCD